MRKVCTALMITLIALAMWTDASAGPVTLCWDYPTTYTSGRPMPIDDVFKVRIWPRPWGDEPDPAWKGHLGETKAPGTCFTTKDFPFWLWACFDVEMVMKNGKESIRSEELCMLTI